MTMTTREVTIFISELGAIRELVGKINERLNTLDKSVIECQARCTGERRSRNSWLHWVGGVVAASVPAVLAYLLMRH